MNTIKTHTADRKKVTITKTIDGQIERELIKELQLTTYLKSITTGSTTKV